MPSVTLPGGPTLAYTEWGRADGSVVLLLHGLGDTKETWRHVAPALGEHFRVIAFDARGHGESEHTAEYSLELMRDDVVGLMEQLGVLAALVMGHSMGGVVAYLLAATRPELVRLLVLEDAPPPDPATPPRELPRDSSETGDTDWHAVIALRRWRNRPDPAWWDLFEKIQARTLVIGYSGSHLPQGPVEEISRRIPQAEYASFDLGHDGHSERPSDFLSVVEPFIAWYAK